MLIDVHVEFRGAVELTLPDDTDLVSACAAAVKMALARLRATTVCADVDRLQQACQELEQEQQLDSGKAKRIFDSAQITGLAGKWRSYAVTLPPAPCTAG